MAWLQKRGGKWWVGWRIGKQEFRKSTGESDKAEAKKQLDAIKRLDMARHSNALTEDYFRAATCRAIDRATVSKFFASWLTESESVTTPSTMSKYRQVVREFCEHVKADATGILMEEVTAEHVGEFLTEKRLKLAAGTIKGYRRILSSVFIMAQNQGKIKGNPVALAKRRGKSNEDVTTRKRPFTLAELLVLHGKADPFWQYMIMVGYHSGQSMGDLITMSTEVVDLQTGLITMNRRKTGKQVIIPMAKPVRELLVSLWPKGGKGYFWPEQATRYLKVGASPFSQEFYELLAGAGLVAKRDEKKKSTQKGRDVKREAPILGFHNLRHTFVTNLKIGGAMDSVAKELAGHGSSAMSAVYTHLPPETLAKAINQLPEFAAQAPKKITNKTTAQN